jgi:PST family polysaccharide transporter
MLDSRLRENHVSRISFAAVRRFANHRVVRNALALYGLQVANNILPFITFPYLTRTLGPEKWGLVGWSQEFVRYFAVITAFGFDFTATRAIAIHRHDPEKISRIFSAVMTARLALMSICLAVMVGIVLATPVLRPNLGLFLISYLTVIAGALFPQWLFQGVEKMGAVTAREIGSRLIALLPIFLLVHGPQDYLRAASVQSGSALLSAVVGLIMAPRIASVRFVRVPAAEVIATMRDGWHVFLSMVAINLYSGSNRFILGFFGGNRAVGLLLAAQRLLDVTKALVIASSEALFPHISRLSASSRSEVVGFFRKYTLRLTIPFAGVSLALLTLAPLAIRIVAGAQFAGSVRLLQLMSPIPWVLALGTVFATQFMLGLGYKKEWSRIIIQGAVLNFAILFLLLRFIDPATAVAITATAVESWIALRSWIFYRSHRDRPLTEQASALPG